jgi:pullulanase/glycogen debranching enzyme
MLFNASQETLDFRLPKIQHGSWKPILDSSQPELDGKKTKGDQTIQLMGHSIIALEQQGRWPKVFDRLYARIVSR